MFTFDLGATLWTILLLFVCAMIVVKIIMCIWQSIMQSRKTWSGGLRRTSTLRVSHTRSRCREGTRLLVSFIFFLICVSLLSSCGFTEYGSAARTFVQERGAQATDEGVDNALWFLCSGTSVGSIRRRFGRDSRSFHAWAIICEQDPQTIILPPEESSGAKVMNEQQKAKSYLALALKAEQRGDEDKCEEYLQKACSAELQYLQNKPQ